MGTTVEAYIDDMVIKSKKAKDHIQDASEVFEIFRWFKIKLNPLKCAFGVSSKQFLGHIINKPGIKPSPAQVKQLSQIEEPKTMRDVQSLAGKVAALSRFISKMFDMCKPFFHNIKQSLASKWGKEQSEATEDHLTKDPNQTKFELMKKISFLMKSETFV